MRLTLWLTGSGLDPETYREWHRLTVETLHVAEYDDGTVSEQRAALCTLSSHPAEFRIQGALHVLTTGLRALQLSDEDRVRALLPEGWRLRSVEGASWVVRGSEPKNDEHSIYIYHPDRATALRLLAAALREMGR